MIPIRLTMVIAKPGARGDFVAGWLGTLPNAVDTQWRIDPVTGRSFGTMNKFKEFTRPGSKYIQLSTLLNNAGYQLDPTSNWMLAISCHGSATLPYRITQEELKSLLILNIVTTPKDDSTIAWEFIVKTHFCQERFQSSFAQNKFYNTADAEDSQRCREIQRKCGFLKHNPDFDLQQLPGINVEYCRISQAGGSRYLTELLGISASEKHHQLWDNNIALATSDKAYQIFGRIWTDQNYLD